MSNILLAAFPLRLFRVKVSKPVFCLSDDSESAICVASSQIKLEEEDFAVDLVKEVEEIDLEWEEKEPLSNGVEPQGSCADYVPDRTYPRLREALLEKSNFPSVPELKPKNQEDLAEVTGTLLVPSRNDDVDGLDWRVREYLFLRYPKLRAAISAIRDENRADSLPS